MTVKRKKEQAREFTVVIGCNTVDEKGKETRWEIGDSISESDVPQGEIKGLLAGKAIEECQ